MTKKRQYSFKFASLFGYNSVEVKADNGKEAINFAITYLAQKHHITETDVRDLFRLEEFKISKVNGHSLNDIELDELVYLMEQQW